VTLIEYKAIGFCVLGVFRGNPKQVKEYQDLLTPVLHQTMEGRVAFSVFP
jgi:hypothetical protein